MRRRRWPFGMLASAGLVILVGVLAWLQYKWLGDVSEADRARRQTLLRQRATDFVDDFDREIARAYVTFQIDGASFERDPAVFAKKYDDWRQNARAPQLIRALYLADASRPGDLLQYEIDKRSLTTTAWPADLEPARARLAMPGAPPRTPLEAIAVFRSPIIPSIPALVVPMTQLQVLQAGSARSIADVHLNFRSVIVVFDREYLQSSFLAALADRYFPQNDVDAYRFAVLDGRESGRTVFSRGLSTGGGIDPKRADAEVSLFTLRPELIDRFLGTPRTATMGASGAVTIVTAKPTLTVPAPRGGGRGLVDFYFEQRTTSLSARGSGPADVLTNVRLAATPAWRLVLQHPAGSLDAAVERTRRRNLALSFGILAVLGASVLMIVMNAQRSKRLAAQQLDFVATVSHELRTPLSVIRSAAQNLSAGVVSEDVQARRYGDLIDQEGRRLSETIEQVLDYAGLSGNREPRNATDIDVADLVSDAVAACEPLFAARQLQLDVRVADHLPHVVGDAAALGRALQNLLTNAVKYGASGGWIGIEATTASTREGAAVQISVSDRGRGIEPSDVPHIFEPFYRGAHAIREQIQGNGLGLSLVKRIVEAHGGRVLVRTEPGQGAAFTIRLRGSEPFSTETHAPVPEVLRADARGTSGT